jgi:di/tricarboxylate transporter
MAGLVYGLLLMWLCLRLTSYIESITPRAASHGCIDSEDCTTLDGIAMSLIAFGPAVLFAILNAVAWKRWPVRTWAARSGIATLLIVALYGALA